MEGFPVCGLTKPCVSVDAVRTPEMTYSSMPLASLFEEFLDFEEVVDFEDLDFGDLVFRDAVCGDMGADDVVDMGLGVRDLRFPSASRHPPASGPDLAFSMPPREDLSSRILQLQESQRQLVQLIVQQSLNAGSQLAPNIHNGVDFNNPASCFSMIVKTQHEVLEVNKQIDRLKESFSKLKQTYVALKQKSSDVEREKGLLKHENMQLRSQLQPQHQQQGFDGQGFLSSAHE